MSRLPAENRSAFAYFHKIESRWNDNDIFGHVNNVVYYSYFDTAVNAFLIRHGVLDLQLSKIVGLVVETQCRYFSSIAFPDTIHVGLRLSHLGTSSIRYEAAVFRNDDDVASAQGHFVHVYVDRSTNRPVPMPQSLIDAAVLLTTDNY